MPWRTVGPPASAVSYGLALARRPCPAQSGQWRPCATGIARRRNPFRRQALAELEQLLAACRQAGWNATLSHALRYPRGSHLAQPKRGGRAVCRAVDPAGPKGGPMNGPPDPPAFPGAACWWRSVWRWAWGSSGPAGATGGWPTPAKPAAHPGRPRPGAAKQPCNNASSSTSTTRPCGTPCASAAGWRQKTGWPPWIFWPSCRASLAYSTPAPNWGPRQRLSWPWPPDAHWRTACCTSS